MVERGGLENRCAPRGHRGFESLSLRNTKLTHCRKVMGKLEWHEKLEQAVADAEHRREQHEVVQLQLQAAVPVAVFG